MPPLRPTHGPTGSENMTSPTEFEKTQPQSSLFWLGLELGRTKIAESQFNTLGAELSSEDRASQTRSTHSNRRLTNPSRVG